MNTKYLYVRNPQKKRDISICSTLDIADEKVNITYGYCFRSNHDQFTKKDGRVLSHDRMHFFREKGVRENFDPGNFSGSFSVNKDQMSYYTIAIEILQRILENSSTPKKYKGDVIGEIEFLKTRMGQRSERVV